MDYRELWDKSISLLREDMADVSYRTWIRDALKPFGLEQDRLYVEVITDFARKTIRSRYQELIANAVAQTYHRALTIEYLTPQEREEANLASGEEKAAFLLNPKYTFETFVVGNANRFAHAASLAVAEAPGDAYNPLFIYGGVGLGKTHLMHAIGHYVQQLLQNQRLLYITSENFTNELIAAIQNNKNTEFRNRFRNLDVLIIDDIQFIAGKERTQEEFFHTFNALHSAGKQVIITSDKPPKEIAKLEERLCSRFEWGLIADIQRPDIETRIAILRKKAESEGMQVDDDVLQLIAGRIESNIRELEGSLTRVMAYASLVGRDVTLDVAEDALRDILTSRDARRVTCSAIQRAVAAYYGVDVAALQGQKRTREVTLPRQVAMFLTREMTNLSLPNIGNEFGGRDHTTVMHSCEKIAELTRSSAKVDQELEDLRKSIADR
ncbi:MAG: chromosomal replication initiator protein DnaA [Oscillospiraceae bacterium]|jgi:chromosomal replication initiator protein|nr:chromosomal replication initiator protein DnaA [Oscillospiraceae bacterium]